MQEQETIFDRIGKGFIIIGIFGLIDVILFGWFGYAGNLVKNCLLGVFGNLAYAYSIAATLSGVFILFGFKPKISPKIIFNYILILLVVICIGHLATYTEFSHLSYNEYLTKLFVDHNSLAGAVVGAFMYPFAKLYAFSMVVFVLGLVGLIALAIVNQLNFEIGFKVRSVSKKTKSYRQPKYDSSYDDSNYYQEEVPVQPEKELYNGDVNGKLFSTGKSKGVKKKEDYSIAPIDEIQDDVVTDDDIISGISLDSEDVASEIELTKLRAQFFGQATPIVEEPGIIKPVEEKPVEQEKKPYVASEEDKQYFNSYRREQSLGDKAKNYTSEIKEDVSFNNAYSMDSFNKKEDSVDPFEAIMSSITKDMQETDLQEKQIEELNKETRVNPVVEEKPIFEPIEENKIEPVEPIIEQKPIEPIKEEKPPIVEPIVQKDAEKFIINEKPEMDLKIVETNTVGTDLYNKNQNVVEEKPQININPVKDYSSDLVKYVTGNDTEKPVEKPKPKRIISKYNPPSYDILTDYPPVDSNFDLTDKAEALKATLEPFKLKINIIGVEKGPTFSRIDFSLEPGTPVSKLTQRIDDIKMGLAVASLRLLAPIPGKNYCGIEIPNDKRSIVGLKDTILAQDYQNAIKSQKGLIFAFGKDISGDSYYFDLTKTPHLLIAGGTGSGKSVALNVLITSLLFRYSPDELRMIMFDPKQVELTSYQHIPHLLIPHILTDPKRAYSSLAWASNEMERRYSLLRVNNVRNLDEYNALDIVKKDPTLKLPYIVIIVDEFGDVMLSEVGKSFEILIQKLAAKARAAGIHLILATQRPSADVISGTIKANLPCRMAFRVSSSIDSSIILNQTGAEELLGNGDLLFLNSSSPGLKRVQGAYVDTQEINSIADYISKNNVAYFDEEIEDAIMMEEKEEEPNEPKQLSMFPDELCVPALEVCINGNQVSGSFLQRKLGVGYARGAKLVDWMMDMGYAKMDGNKRVMAITRQELDEIKEKGNGDGTII